MLRSWAPLVMVVLVALPAQAHDADVIYAQLRHREGGYSELVTLTATTLSLLVPVDADGDQLLTQGDLDARANALRAGVWDDMPLSAGAAACTVTTTAARMRDGFIELTADFSCPVDGELRQDFRILRVLPTNYRVVLGTQREGESGSRLFAQGSFTSLTIPRPAPPGAWDAAGFARAFDDGLRRGGSLLFLAAIWALCAVCATWKRGLRALGLFAAGLIAGSQVDGGVIPPVAAVAVLAAACAALKDPPLPIALVLGAALGSIEAGGGLANGLGLAAGSLVITVPAGLAAIAVGRMLQRRASAWRILEWAGVAGVLVGGATRLW